MRTLQNCLRALLLGCVAFSTSHVLAEPTAIVSKTWSIAAPKLQQDFPALCVDAEANPWVAYVQFNGKADELKVALKTEDGLQTVGSLAGPGIIHQPAIACDGKGAIDRYQAGDSLGQQRSGTGNTRETRS